jgi:hypothetical protein
MSRLAGALTARMNRSTSCRSTSGKLCIAYAVNPWLVRRKLSRPEATKVLAASQATVSALRDYTCNLRRPAATAVHARSLAIEVASMQAQIGIE